MKQTHALAGALVATALLLSGCTPSPPNTNAAVDDTFVYAASLESVTEWDPAVAYGAEIQAFSNIYDKLTRYNAETEEVDPELATKWEHSEDGLTWTFTLRNDAKFHNGRPVDSAAVKQAIERTIKLNGGPAYIWSAVDSISTPSADTVVFNLKYPAPLDLVTTSGYGAYIYDVQAAGSEDLAKWLASGKDAGSGPYTVSKWNPGEEASLRLTAQREYWGGWKDNSYKNVEFRTVPERTTAWQLIQAGKIDMVQRLTPQLFAEAEKSPSVVTLNKPLFQNALAFFNTKSGPMQDVRVRKAVQAAIDYAGTVEALEGSAVAASGVIPEGIPAYTPGLEKTQDLDQAAKLLAEAGYGPGGKPLTLKLTITSGLTDEELAATLMTSALAKVNVTLDVQVLQWEAQWNKAKSEDPAEVQDMMMFYYWPEYPTPTAWLTKLFRTEETIGFNLAYYYNPAADAAIDNIDKLLATDKAAAERAVADLQKTILVDDAAAAPLWVQTSQSVIAKSVEGYVENPAYPETPDIHALTRTSSDD
ncbi:ABC transporter substrate-binding protein [Arthrobacter sp. R4]|uniref:ABC transporter substrate-binding protein n=1 Tax=Arthrobacter sp. R4 TaxID=644417 RepID=UPI003ED9799B